MMLELLNVRVGDYWRLPHVIGPTSHFNRALVRVDGWERIGVIGDSEIAVHVTLASSPWLKRTFYLQDMTEGRKADPLEVLSLASLEQT